MRMRELLRQTTRANVAGAIGKQDAAGNWRKTSTPRTRYRLATLPLVSRKGVRPPRPGDRSRPIRLSETARTRRRVVPCDLTRPHFNSDGQIVGHGPAHISGGSSHSSISRQITANCSRPEYVSFMGQNCEAGGLPQKPETVTSHSHRASARCRTTIRNAEPFLTVSSSRHNTEAVDYAEVKSNARPGNR